MAINKENIFVQLKYKLYVGNDGEEVMIEETPDDQLFRFTTGLKMVLPKFEEACYLGLAPTSSTTATLVYGDALAVVASASYGFRDIDFGKYHPAGALGKKLILKVKDIMAKDTKK